MEQERSFLSAVCHLAVPVALQSMLQSSFSIVDQVMIGQLGSVSVAGVGLAGKFINIYIFLSGAIGGAAGIMIAQYMGQGNRGEVRRSFRINLAGVLLLAALFTGLCRFWPGEIMGLYSRDGATVRAAGEYLSILAGMFFPAAGATMLAVMFRCLERTALPLCASIGAAVLNTGLNYGLIFGRWGLPALGVRGAAIATVCSQTANFLIMLWLFRGYRGEWRGTGQRMTPFRWGQYAVLLAPMLASELMWCLGENVYAAIYGHLGTDSAAAMVMIDPVQGMMTGALCGLSQAAGVLIGKKLGSGEYELAYAQAKKLMCYGFVAAGTLSAVILLLRGQYVQVYQVEPQVRELTRRILLFYALVAPFKVQNMIVSGGVLQSGGRTVYVMAIDILGTWGIGVPLGLVSAFVWELPVYWVYFLLSLEECVRYGVSLVVLRRKKWMTQL